MAFHEGFIRVDFECNDEESKQTLRELAEAKIEAHKSWSGYSEDTVDSLSWLTDGWDARKLTIDSEFVNNGTRKRLREFLNEVRSILPGVKFSGALHVDNMVNGTEVAHWTFTDEKMRQSKQSTEKRRPAGGSLGGGWTKKRMKHLEGALFNQRYTTQDIFRILDETEGDLPPEYLTGICDEGSWSSYEMKPYGEIWRGLSRRRDTALYQAFRNLGMPLPLAEGSGYSGATLTFSWVLGSPETSEEIERFTEYLTRLLDDGLEFRLSPENSAAAQSVAKNLGEMQKMFVVYMPEHVGLLKRLNEAGFNATPAQKDAGDIWGHVIDSGSTELADFFDGLGVRPEGSAALGPYTSKEMLEWLIDHGFGIDCVDLTCTRDVLERCRELGIPPTSDCVSSYSVGTRFGGDFEHKSDDAMLAAIEESGGFAISHDGTLVAYRGKDAEVIVPDGVERIVSGAFTGNSHIVSVELPESLRHIEKFRDRRGAFSGCSKLESVKLHTKVSQYRPESNETKIDSGSFSECPNLNAIDAVEFSMRSSEAGVLCATRYITPVNCVNGSCVFPEGVEEVSMYDFSNSRKVVLPTTVIRRRLGADLGHGLEDIEVAEGHPSLRVVDGALVDKDDLIAFPSLRVQNELVVPGEVKIVSSWAFDGCEDLGRIVFQEAPTRIGKCAFFGCMSDLVMPAGAPDQEDGAFQHFQGKLIYLGKDFFLTQKAIGSDFECECTLVLPSVAISAVPAAFKLNAAIGYMELAVHGRLDSDIEEGYAKYVASQKKKLYGNMLRNESVAAYMLNEAIVPKKDIDTVVELAHGAGNDGLIQKLAEYAQSPKKKVDWRPDKPAIDDFL